VFLVKKRIFEVRESKNIKKYQKILRTNLNKRDLGSI